MKEKMPDSKSRKRRIDEALLLIAEIYEKHMSESVINAYHKSLAPYKLEDIEAALGIWIDESEFFPKPSQLIKIIEKNTGLSIDIDARALQQWQLVLMAVRQHGASRPQTFADPVTQHLIKTQFSWTYLCTMPEFDQKWEQKRWCESFDLTASTREDLLKLQVPEQILEALDKIGTKIEPKTRTANGREVPVVDIRAYLDKKKKAFKATTKKQEMRTPLQRQADLKKQAAKLLEEDNEKQND